MKHLEPPDSQHLEAAQGWLYLGDRLEANEELERIRPSLRSHPDVLEVRWQVYAKAEKWDACLDIATAIIKLAPEQADGWLHRSHALHQLKRTQEAFDQLVPLAEKFTKLWTIPYTLVCCCAQLGRFDESEEWLKKAAAINEQIGRRLLKDEPDLKPLIEFRAERKLRKLNETPLAKAADRELTEHALHSKTMPFHVALYHVRGGDLEMAREWLKVAFANAGSEEERKRLKLRILNEPDLKPLWHSLPNP